MAVALLTLGILALVRARSAAPSPPAVDVHDAAPGLAEAIETARRGVEQSPHSAAAWGRLGMVLRAHDFNSEANRCFAQAEKLDPADPRWPYHQALDLLIFDPEAGLACLQRAAKLSGPADPPCLLLGEVLLGLGRSDEAEPYFHHVLAVENSNPRAHLGLGCLAYARGDLPTSLKHLHTSANEAPWVQATHALLAEISFRQGDKKAADEERRIVDRLPPKTLWPDAHVEEVERLRVGTVPQIAFASQLVHQGRVSQALGVLQDTVRQHPESYDALLALGNTYLKLQPPNYPAAEAVLQNAARRRPDDPAAQFHLGIALERQGKFRAAADCYGKAIELKPDHAYAHYNRGQCLKQQGDPTGALQALRNAVRFKPNFAEGHRDLGELLAQSGQDADALVQLQQASQLNPADEKTKRLLEEVRKRTTSQE